MGNVKNENSNNKKIAKNTLLLYLRMLATMAVGLYTSRVILATLGVEDYGIYNVVGGFVSMFSVISATMTTATQRFLSFEIGKKNGERIKELFSTAVMIHLLLAVIILLVAETLGLWFVNQKMVFPAGREIAANWVFQLSILTFMVNVASVPYNAALIAYERMSAFAYISILEVVLKLLLVLGLSFIHYDKLIMFAIFIAGISIVLRGIYGIYVNKHFPECKCTWVFDKPFFNQLLSFISWNFIGSIAGILKEQGLNVLLNLFFGAAVNAARGIAYQVLRAVSGFISNFQLALNPQIIKYYASNQKEQMFRLVSTGSKFSYLLMMTLSIPIIIEAPYILNLWLVEVPNYTVVFLRIVLLITLVDSLSNTLITSVHASGKVKWYQIINGSILLFTLPIVYVVLRMGAEPYMAMIVSLAMSVITLFVRLTIIKYIISFPMRDFVLNVVLRVFFCSTVAYLPMYFLEKQVSQTFLSFILLCASSLTLSCFVSFLIGLNVSERSHIINLIKKKIHYA